MLRILFFSLFSCSFVLLVAQNAPDKRKGLLWEISGNGIARPGYLYGTMHVPEKLAFNLSDSFFIALKQVDIVALETDHDQWQAFTEILNGGEGELFEQSRPGSDILVQPDLYQAAFRFPIPDNQLLGAVLSSKPRMTNEFLFRSNQYRQEYEEDTYLDLFIFQAGRKLGKQVIGLETMEGSYEAYVRAQIPDEEDSGSPSDRYYPGLYSRATLEDAYRDQDLALIDSLNKMMRPGKNFQRWMQDERNKIMAEGIDSVLQSGTALLAAVGAAHLPGNQGLIQSLLRKGYALRPVQFSSEHSKQEKDSIEAMRFPVHFSMQCSTDSTWSVEAPGAFYQTADAQGLTQHLCADMSNGAYYAVYQLRSYAAWNGQSPGYIAARIDSLIYEKIPGKIQERTRLTQPYPGHEITTRTRRGDILRYKIFATPMDVFVFATGGNGAYAAGEEGNRFLASIRFKQPNSAHEPGDCTVRPPEGGFRITFPAAPYTNSTGDPKADRCFAMATDPADSAVYVFCRASYHDWNYIEEDSFELNIIGEKIAASFTETPALIQLMDAGLYPAADVSFRSDRDSAWYFVRIVIEGPHYYLLGCRKSGPVRPESFFASFAIEPARYPDGWVEIPDTAGRFRVRIPAAAVEAEHPFRIRLRRIVEEGFRKSREAVDVFPVPEKNYVRTLKLPIQGEAVFVQTTAISAAKGMPTLDSFQLFWQKRLSNYRKVTLQTSRWESPHAALLVGNFLLTDTNSTRAIRTKIMVTPGQVYALSATVHSGAPESDFIRTVFDSFTPADTTPGVLPFGRRNLQYLQDLYSPDSLLREQALDELNTIWKKEVVSTDFPAFQVAIEYPDFNNLRYTARAELLTALGYFPSAEALDFVLTLIDQYPDSARYRQTLLVALARMWTRPASEALLRQLLGKPAYLTNNNISEIFGALNDTLELAAGLFPAALPLAGWAEYRDYVYNLLDRLLDQKLIRPNTFARLKPALIRETATALGQLQYESELRADSDGGDLYRYGGYESAGGNTADNLRRQLRLLAPFIPKDNKVRALFRQATRCANHSVRATACCLLLREGQAVDRGELEALAADDRTRILLYRQLVSCSLLEAYAGWFSDTLALVRSVLVSETNISSGPEPDSIRFVSSCHTWRAGSPSVLYFFEVKGKKDAAWRLAFLVLPFNAQLFGAAPRPADRDTPEAYLQAYADRPEAKVLPEMPEREKEIFIRKKVGEIRFATRERYKERDTPGRW